MLRITAFSSTLLALASGTALADVTADQVWQGWQTRLADLGYEVTGTPQREGDRLVVTGITLAQDYPEEGGRAALEIGRIAFEERGDGTVAVIYPETMPMTLDVMPEADERVTATLTLSHEALSITASGTPDAIAYAYEADSLRLELADVMVEGEPDPALTAQVSFDDVSGTSESGVADGLRRSAQTLLSGAMSYVLTAEPEEAQGPVRLEGSAQSFEMETGMSVPLDTGLDDMAAALRAGFAVEGRLLFGPGESRSVVTEEGATARMEGRSDGSRIEMALSEDGLRAAVESEGTAGRMEGGDLPFPVAYEAEGAALRLQLPVARAEETQEFALSVDLSQASVSEELWAMVDPEGLLPREPGNLALALTGAGQVRVDFFDEEAMEAIEEGETTGFEPERVVLERLLVELAGATLTGAGAVDIDPEASDAMGMPAADGAVDLRLEGGNRLLDRLVALGLLSDDEATTARMMAAMFARPAEGEPDTLTSRIEIEPDGRVTVNGQRMR